MAESKEVSGDYSRIKLDIRNHIQTMETVKHNRPGSIPFSIPERKVTITDSGFVKKILSGVFEKRCFLTLIDARGQKYEKSIILGMENGSLTLDKPPDWNKNITFCHVYFKNEIDTWSFFRIHKIYEQEYSLKAEVPRELYYFES